MIKSIEYKGIFAKESGLPGEGRENWFTPGQGNVLQLSKDIFIVAFSIRGIRGVDDDTSVVYQLRKGSEVGEIIKEGYLAESSNTWDPFNRGVNLVKQHGHVVLLGVPKGAKINGKTPEHANVFKAMWRMVGRFKNPETGQVEIGIYNSEAKKYEAETQNVEYIHFKLNDAEDDIEFIHKEKNLREKGYEETPSLCRHDGVEHINRNFVNPIDINEDCTEWADMVGFKGTGGWSEHGHGSVVVIKHKFNSKTGIYDWAETSDVLPDGRLFEAAIAAHPEDGYMITPRVAVWGDSIRKGKPAQRSWCKVDDPFQKDMKVEFEDWGSNVPLTIYNCADNVTRFFTGEAKVSPYGGGRGPIFCWDIAADGSLSNMETVIDGVVERILPGEMPFNLCHDFAKILDHTGGNKQLVIFRMKTYNLMYQLGKNKPMTREQLEIGGIHYCEITYDQDYPARWLF